MATVRDEILSAAGRLLYKYGLTGTTIDAVAAEAGMTKGGVLYHFPSKRRLLQATLERINDEVASKINHIISANPGTSPLRAYVMAVLSFLKDTGDEATFGIGLMGDEFYCQMIRDIKESVYRDLSATVRNHAGLVVILSILDGIWINNIFRSEAITPDLHDKAVKVLLAMTDDVVGDGTMFASCPAATKGSEAGVPLHEPTATNFRDRILAATARILARHGLAKTTYEAVAREAGMSKGGILHYYPSRRELMTGVVRWFEDQYFASREATLAALPPSPSRLARATVLTIVERRKDVAGSANYRVDMLEDPDFRGVIGELKNAASRDVLAGAQCREKVLIAIYMMDGMWMHSLFTTNPFPQAVVKDAHVWLDSFLEEQYEQYT